MNNVHVRTIKLSTRKAYVPQLGEIVFTSKNMYLKQWEICFHYCGK